MPQAERHSLRQENPDLHRLTSPLTSLKLWKGDRKVTIQDIQRGVESSSAPEFLARCFARKESHRALVDALDATTGDTAAKADIRKEIVAIADSPEGTTRLAQSVLDVMTKGVVHPIRIKRLQGTLKSDDGMKLHEDLFSKPGSGIDVGSLDLGPAGNQMMNAINSTLGRKAIGALLVAKAENHKLREKPNAKLLWDAAQAVNTDHIKATMSSDDIAGVLGGTDKKKVFQAVAEFFSSVTKYSQFQDFMQGDQNRRLLTRLLAMNPEYTTFAFYSVLKTSHGEDRLALAMRDQNDVICGIAASGVGYVHDASLEQARSLRSDEAMHAVQNAPDGSGARALVKLLGMEGGVDAAVNIQLAETNTRFMLQEGGRGDLVVNKAVMKEILGRDVDIPNQECER